MPPGDPDILVSRWGDGGLVWTILISALAHAVLIAVLLMTPQRFLGAPSPLESYTVELVAPELIGGSNLAPARVEADEGSAEMPELPTVEPAPPPEPVSPPTAEEPEAIEPAAEKEEAAEAEAVPEVVDEEEPAPPEQVKAEELAPETEEAAKPEAASAVVAEEKPAPSAEAEQNDDVGQSEAQAAAIAPPTAAPKSKAKEQAKAKPKKNVVQKSKKEEKARAVAAQKKKPTAAAKSGIDQKIAAAVQRRAEQVVRRSAGAAQPGAGGPIAHGPGSGAGGLLKGLDYIFYRRQMEERIKAAWAWAGAEASLQAVISFNITPSGRIINVRTVNSSGDPSYDASAERAVRAANPLAPPPAQYLFEFSTVELTFRPEDLRRKRAMSAEQ